MSVAEKIDLTEMVTASSLAKLAVMDMYGNYVDDEARALVNVIRGIKKLTRQSVKSKKRYAILNINKNTRTAILPCEYRKVISVFVIDSCDNRVDLNVNHKIINTEVLEEIPCENECDKDCGCYPKQMCQDLSTSQVINKIRIGDTDYDETITYYLQPNGEYKAVTTTPYLNIGGGGGVIYKDKTDYVTTFDVADCGCIKQTEQNDCRLEVACPDVWACYCCDSCASADNDLGGYNIFPESGIIKFDRNFIYDKAYMAYRGFLPKQGNEYLIPEVASDAVVNWAKFLFIQNKKGVSRSDREWFLERYEQEYKNLRIITCRVSISDIINRVLTVPKFDYNSPVICVSTPSLNNISNITANIAAVTAITSEVVPATGLPSTGCNPAIITTNGQEMEGGVTYRNPTLVGVPFRIFATAINRALNESEYTVLTSGGFTITTGGIYGLLDQFDIFPKWCDANVVDIPDVIVQGMRKKAIKVDGLSGSPVAGLFTYQHNDLIGSTIEDITVNKMLETVIDLDFTFNSSTGTITRTQVWQTGDTGIITYMK